ncbi:MAG: hypothetical protein J6S59_02585 [Clostridia bacterium]|nr:hypothetical protein [Clostridia bacterium]
MADYQKLYHILFNAITDAVEQLDEQHFAAAKALLIEAQQRTEEEYINSAD